jgi:hypothetical protein
VRLSSGAFSDPQGDDTFAALKWRVAEVPRPGLPAFDPQSPRIYEVHAAWESDELGEFVAEVQVPPETLKVGATYRARVRHKDNTGRWSHWSEPLEFTAGAPAAPFPQQSYLRISEIHYHPIEDEEHEFIEFQNTGPTPLDLRPVVLSGGIGFEFSAGEVGILEPGAFVVVVKDREVFRTRYGEAGIAVAGEYFGSLGNGGDHLLLTHGPNATILDFSFSDAWYPLTDGGGPSLVIADALAPAESWGGASGWRPSAAAGGSPGRGEDGPTPERAVTGDLNQNAVVEISDAVTLLLLLFDRGARSLPCGGSSIEEGANLALADFDGDRAVGITDAVRLLEYLFREGPPHVLGTGCTPIPDCPGACGG